MRERVSTAVALIAELATTMGVRRINELPACWEHTFGPWFVAVNGHNAPTKCSTGAELPPFGFFVECNGWPAALLQPNGGAFLGGCEDEFIAAVQAEIAATSPRRSQP